MMTLAAARRALTAVTVPYDGCRIGVDVIGVADIAGSLDRFGNRYLERIFTDHEHACCTGSADVMHAGLAARFAAKEATVKVLRPRGPQPAWTTMEVVRTPSGACDLRLHGDAAALAAQAGLHSFAVSLSHEGGLAVAIVMALSDARRRQCAPGDALYDPQETR